MLVQFKNSLFKKSIYLQKKSKKRNNFSGKNNSGKLVIRFRSKHNIKKIYFYSKLNQKNQLTNLTHFPTSLSTYCSIFFPQKDLLFTLGLLIKNFNYQVIQITLRNYIFFFKRIFYSNNTNFKFQILLILNIVRKELNFFYSSCLNNLQIGKSIHANLDPIDQNMFKKGDIGLVKDFTENTFVRNIYTYKKKIFISPGTTGLILNKNSKFTLVLTPKKRIIKLGLKSIGQFCSSTLKKKKKKIHEKASVIKYLKVRSRVLGKSMNICDRPNGGYKHASKILKNFKSRKILK